jgi:hypothetical protein
LIGTERKRRMEEVKEEKVYKSPRRKLVKFFEKSRDQWKEKCREAKEKLKRLKNRIRFLEASKAKWKNRAKELERETARLKTDKEAVERELESLKKKRIPGIP